MWSKILLAVDGSENNKIAVKRAISLAKGMGSEVTAIHVVGGVELKYNIFGGEVSQEERQKIIDAESKKAFEYIEAIATNESVELKTIVKCGNPGKEIVKISNDYDVIVCGSLGLTGKSKILMGSVSSDIVRNAECAVLIARDN